MSLSEVRLSISTLSARSASQIRIINNSRVLVEFFELVSNVGKLRHSWYRMIQRLVGSRHTLKPTKNAKGQQVADWEAVLEFAKRKLLNLCYHTIIMHGPEFDPDGKIHSKLLLIPAVQKPGAKLTQVALWTHATVLDLDTSSMNDRSM